MKQLISKSPVIVLLIMLFHLSAFCQTNNDALKGIVTKLKDFSFTHVAEKA